MSAHVNNYVQSDPICSSAGCGYASEKGKTAWPMDYFVPNFGMDEDIKVSQQNEANAIRMIKFGGSDQAPAT